MGRRFPGVHLRGSKGPTVGPFTVVRSGRRPEDERSAGPVQLTALPGTAPVLAPRPGPPGMYEAVRARPAGPSTVARLAATAADYGYDGLVIVNSPEEPPAWDPAAIEATFGLDVVEGLTLTPDNRAAARGAVGHHRPETTVLALDGGDPAVNAFGVRQTKVDVLRRPMAGDGDLDHVLVRLAAEHDVHLTVELGPVLRSTGPARTKAIAGLRKLRELVEDADAPFVVTAGAGSHLELRAPRELAAVADTAGFDREAVERGLAAWGHLAAVNRARRSADMVEPGVRRGRWEGG